MLYHYSLKEKKDGYRNIKDYIRKTSTIIIIGFTKERNGFLRI